jgi:ribosomal protein S18 acetylase RimI-like enzyme
VKTLALKRLSAVHVANLMDRYLAISADVSPWTSENFLKELPGKWELSFALWDQGPIAYCIMSLREDAVHIHQFMVAADKRGTGIGSQMMHHAASIAAQYRSRITLKVPHAAKSARKFYLRHGFQNHSVEGDYVLMERSIEPRR